MPTIERIRSGGQTGADRGALDAARDAGIPITGWCPRGGWAEDAPDPPGVRAAYPELTETDTDDPADRTIRNVRDADATLIVVPAEAWHSPGTDLTRQAALRLGRPVLTLADDDLAPVTAWLETVGCRELNVAGPRESQAPGIHARTREVVRRLLRE
ncbi:putative molybdenum carrier protein [Microbacterium thalassium]|uniref:Molybdenum cofactor carrier n=1 Tax=Microbacterium thalassium TaxID=362649 RepID=A0A7X0FS75_9MICO|nr:putative molybdenum carrier protein [Microbacterium thalassium]MBB6392753.1 hypothetical protein [Microbacterium thalassium]GLK23015.1 hypothetical protein GCM10017607_03330 [Microbacterium thalassium]